MRDKGYSIAVNARIAHAINSVETGTNISSAVSNERELRMLLIALKQHVQRKRIAYELRELRMLLIALKHVQRRHAATLKARIAHAINSVETPQ